MFIWRRIYHRGEGQPSLRQASLPPRWRLIRRPVRRILIRVIEMTKESTIDSLISDLRITRGNTRQRATDELVKIGEPAIEPLLRAIQEDDRSESMVDYEHRFLREVLVKMEEPAFNKLIEALIEQSNIIRGRAVVKTLVLFDDIRVVEPFVEVMLDERYGQTTRCYAIDALGYFKDPRAFEPLMAALHDEDVLIVGHAARALGEYQDKRAL